MLNDLEQYQSKSITPVDEYVCELSDELKKIAEDELGETEEKRTAGIKAMRDWIMANPRIEKCRMDSKFILRFLRFRKYNVPLAQDAFERWILFREGLCGYDWFSNLDFTRPNVETLIDNGLLHIFHKKDHLGRTVILGKLSATDANLASGTDGLAITTMMFETILEDEENQIRGLNYILDVSNISLRHYFIFSFPTWFRFGKNVEKTFTARHKGIHVVNIHPTLMFIAKIAMRHMPDKLRKRVQFYANFDETDIIPRSELPVEYGGSADSRVLTDALKKMLESRQDFLFNYNQMKVNRSLYTDAQLKCHVSTLNKPLGKTKVPKVNSDYKPRDLEID